MAGALEVEQGRRLVGVGEHVGGGLVDRHRAGAGRRVGPLPGMQRERVGLGRAWHPPGGLRRAMGSACASPLGRPKPSPGAKPGAARGARDGAGRERRHKREIVVRAAATARRSHGLAAHHPAAVRAAVGACAGRRGHARRLPVRRPARGDRDRHAREFRRRAARGDPDRDQGGAGRFRGRAIPDIFWYTRTLRYAFSPQPGPAPLVFIIPGTGAGFNSAKSVILQRGMYAGRLARGLAALADPSELHRQRVGLAPAGALAEDAADLYRRDGADPPSSATTLSLRLAPRRLQPRRDECGLRRQARRRGGARSASRGCC